MDRCLTSWRQHSPGSAIARRTWERFWGWYRQTTALGFLSDRPTDDGWCQHRCDVCAYPTLSHSLESKDRVLGMLVSVAATISRLASPSPITPSLSRSTATKYISYQEDVEPPTEFLVWENQWPSYPAQSQRRTRSKYQLRCNLYQAEENILPQKVDIFDMYHQRQNATTFTRRQPSELEFEKTIAATTRSTRRQFATCCIVSLDERCQVISIDVSLHP